MQLSAQEIVENVLQQLQEKLSASNVAAEAAASEPHSPIYANFDPEQPNSAYEPVAPNALADNTAAAAFNLDPAAPSA